MLCSLWLHALAHATCSNDWQEESCESAIHENIAEMKSGWKHAVAFQRVYAAACHYLNWELGTFWKQHKMQIKCRQSFCQLEQSLTLFLLLIGVVPTVPNISVQGCFGRDHSSGQEHASPQSAVFSRCAVPLCLVIHITNSLAPGSSSWTDLTVSGVACGASLDSHTVAKQNMHK